MKITLPNSLVVEGTPSQVEEVARKFGYSLTSVRDGNYYYSESKREWIRIADMNTLHIRNALLKIYGAWVEEQRLCKDPQELYRKIVNGPSDPTLVKLLAELSRRDE